MILIITCSGISQPVLGDILWKKISQTNSKPPKIDFELFQALKLFLGEKVGEMITSTQSFSLSG